MLHAKNNEQLLQKKKTSVTAMATIEEWLFGHYSEVNLALDGILPISAVSML